MKKITKEELIAENARLKSELEETNNDFKNYGDVARKNLATTLGITTNRITGYGITENKLPEWSEIYARIGELRTIENWRNDSSRISNLEDQVHNLQIKLSKLDEKTNE